MEGAYTGICTPAPIPLATPMFVTLKRTAIIIHWDQIFCGTKYLVTRQEIASDESLSQLTQRHAFKR